MKLSEARRCYLKMADRGELRTDRILPGSSYRCVQCLVDEGFLAVVLRDGDKFFDITTSGRALLEDRAIKEDGNG